MPRVLFALFSSFLLSACGGDSIPPGGSVEIRSLGAEPRAPLRFAFVEGAKAQQVVDMKFRLDMGSLAPRGRGPGPAESKLLDFLNLPTFRMSSELECTELRPEGSARFRQTMREMRFLRERGTNPTLRLMLEPVFSEFRNVVCEQKINVRGGIEEMKLQLPEKLRGQLEKGHGKSGFDPESFAESFANNPFNAVFPEESLGIGARWINRMPLDAGGQESLVFESGYELVGRDAKSLELQCTLEAEIGPEHLSLPPPREGVPQLSMRFIVKGKGRLRISTGLPCYVGNLDMRIEVRGEPEASDGPAFPGMTFEARIEFHDGVPAKATKQKDTKGEPEPGKDSERTAPSKDK